MWALAEYCGLDIVTYALMSNHYHVLVRVPKRVQLSDQDLLRRYRRLYSNLKPQQEVALQAVEKDMVQNGDLAQAWRERQLRQMFDVSVFNKLLKMRFSIWYNKTYSRIGTFWSERFKSILVEPGEALEEVAAYIDLNAVRAGIEKDPKDYRYCGYAEAVAGEEQARNGIGLLYNGSWEQVAETYRCALLGRLSAMKEGQERLDQETLERIASSHGRLPLSVQMGCRVRYYIDGKILGTKAYVLEKVRLMAGERRREPRGLAFGGQTGAGKLYIVDRLLPAVSAQA
jgi:putative transposase